MPTCKECASWGALLYDEFPDIISNQFPGYDYGHKNCGHPKVGGASYNDEASNSPDALNSYESIGTGPNFGCIHWSLRIETRGS